MLLLPQPPILGLAGLLTMGVNTFSAAVHIAPGTLEPSSSSRRTQLLTHNTVTFKTFVKHGRTKARKFKNGEPEEATDDIFFDECVTRQPP